MKKLLAFTLAMILAFSLIACGDGKCETHLDGDLNGKCDNCGFEMEKKPCAEDAHVDTAKDGICDKCGAEVPVDDPQPEIPFTPGSGGGINTPIIPMEPEF